MSCYERHHEIEEAGGLGGGAIPLTISMLNFPCPFKWFWRPWVLLFRGSSRGACLLLSAFFSGWALLQIPPLAPATLATFHNPVQGCLLLSVLPLSSFNGWGIFLARRDPSRSSSVAWLFPAERPSAWARRKNGTERTARVVSAEPLILRFGCFLGTGMLWSLLGGFQAATLACSCSPSPCLNAWRPFYACQVPPLPPFLSPFFSLWYRNSSWHLQSWPLLLGKFIFPPILATPNLFVKASGCSHTIVCLMSSFPITVIDNGTFSFLFFQAGEHKE